jgi:hypothetical protein
MTSLKKSQVGLSSIPDIDLGTDTSSNPKSGAKIDAPRRGPLSLAERLSRNRVELERLKERRAAKAQQFKDAASDLRRQIAQCESAARAADREHRKTAMRSVLHHLGRVALESAKRSAWSSGPLILEKEHFDHILAAEELELITKYLAPQTVPPQNEPGSNASEAGGSN